MIRWSKILILQIPLIGLSLGSVVAQENIMDFSHSLKFARYLHSTRQYAFAAHEYERINFLWPNDSSVILELVQTYRLNHQCEKFESSRKLLSLDDRLYTNPIYTKEYLKYALQCKIKVPEFPALSSLLSPEEDAFYTVSHSIIHRKYQDAFLFNRTHAEVLKSACPELFDLTSRFENQKYKKPGLALLMSSIVPGSGKAYTGRWGDAFISFLFVTTNAYASYRAFHKKGIKSVNGWIFGGIAFSFYSANLFGSFKAVKQHNATLQSTFQNHAENSIYRSF
jgi:hypothetical protein